MDLEAVITAHQKTDKSTGSALHLILKSLCYTISTLFMLLSSSLYLNAQGLDVVCAVGTACEIQEIEVDLIPAIIQA